MKNLTPFKWGCLAAALVLIVDQATKWLILSVLMNPPQRIPITDFLNLVLVFNRGVSFGMLSEGPNWVAIALMIFAMVLSAALCVWMWHADKLLLGIALGLVVGGAIGNVVDRILHGAVVDFVDFHVAGYHWPAFNVADSAITLGVVILIFDSLKSKPAKP